jgi:hypothetical protein
MSNFIFPHAAGAAVRQANIPELSRVLCGAQDAAEELDVCRKQMETSFEQDPSHVDVMDWTGFLDKLNEFAFSKASSLLGPGSAWASYKAAGAWECDADYFRARQELLDGPMDAQAATVVAGLRVVVTLLRHGRNKRYFLSTRIVGAFIRCNNMDIVQLAVEVLFLYAAHGNTVLGASWGEREGQDGAAVPQEVSEVVLDLFDGLSAFSTGYGMLDFIRGHDPGQMRSGKFSVQFPAVTRTSGASSSSSGEGDVMEGGGDQKQEEEVIPAREVIIDISSPDADVEDLSHYLRPSQSEDDNHTVAMLGLMRTMSGLRQDMDARIRLTEMRLSAFAIVLQNVHIPTDKLKGYLSGNSKLVKDLVALSDRSSEAVLDIGVDRTVTLSCLATRCTLALMEAALHRRGSLRQLGVLQQLGMSKAGEQNAVSGDGAWLTVVLSACTAASSVWREGGPGPSVRPDVVEATTKQVLAALDVFSTALANRDMSVDSVNSNAVHAVTRLLKAVSQALPAVLQRYPDPSSTQVPAPMDQACLNITAKVLQSLESVLPCHHAATFRECDGMTSLEAILSSLSKREVLQPLPLLVMQRALAMLTASIGCNRRGALNTTQSGVQILYSTHFKALCARFYSRPANVERERETLYRHSVALELASIFLQTISSEPAYLGYFLAEPNDDEDESKEAEGGTPDAPLKAKSQAQALVDFFVHPTHGPSWLKLSCLQYNNALVSELMGLARHMSITRAGKEWLGTSGLVTGALSAVLHQSNMLPSNEGFSHEALSSMGKTVGSLMKDCPHMYDTLVEWLRDSLFSTCAAAEKAWVQMSGNLSAQSGVIEEMDSDRMQALQKVANLCAIVGTIGNDRRAVHECMHQILTRDVTEKLLKCYRYTMPMPRQLFAQVSKQDKPFNPHWGYHPTTSSITALLRDAAGISGLPLLGLIFKQIDESLGDISAAKQMLRALSKQPRTAPASEGGGEKVSSASAGVSAGTGTGDMDAVDDTAAEMPQPSRRRRSRGSSLGSGAAVLILGVLDCIPDMYVFDDDAATEHRLLELEPHIWRFLVSTIMLAWLPGMVMSCLRVNRGPNPNSAATVMENKDILRRLFAFHRSSLLETCRFFAEKKWSKSVQSDEYQLTTGCDTQPNDTEVNARCKPNFYVVRVVNHTGALLRDGPNIDGSRVVVLVPVGTVLVAWDRTYIQGGVMRYRTDYGWLSECRQYHRREPIVEVLDISLTEHPLFSASTRTPTPRERLPVTDATIWAMTLRESMAYVMEKVHANLTVVAIFLARSAGGDLARGHGFGGSPTALPHYAPALSSSLANIFCGFVGHPLRCLADSDRPKNIAALETGVNALLDPPFSTHEGGVKALVSTTSHSQSSQSSSGGGGGKRRKSRSSGDKDGGREKDGSNAERRDGGGGSSDYDDGVARESISVDAATVCLYMSTFIRNVLAFAVSDKPGKINI